MNEPTYIRLARALMDVLTPEGIDAFLLGLSLALGSAILFAYVYWQL